MIDYFKKQTKKQMVLWRVGTYTGYFLLSIIFPVLTILVNYNLLSPEAPTKTRLGGWVVVLLLIAGIVSVFVIKKAINKLKDTSPASAYFKYSLKTVCNIILPVGIIFAIIFLKDDFVLACNTLTTMCIFYIAAGLLDGILISFVERETNARDNALQNKEIEDRKNLV